MYCTSTCRSVAPARKSSSATCSRTRLNSDGLQSTMALMRDGSCVALSSAKSAAVGPLPLATIALDTFPESSWSNRAPARRRGVNWYTACRYQPDCWLEYAPLNGVPNCGAACARSS